MKVFLSYSRHEVGTAEEIALRIGAGGDKVFFDRDSLPKGDQFDLRIRREVYACSLFVFLISPASVASGGYARTELKFARERWPQPGNHVLPVMVRPTKLDEVPPYLRAINILEAEGNLAAEVASEVHRLSRIHGRQGRRRLDLRVALAIVTFVVFFVLGCGAGGLIESRTHNGPAGFYGAIPTWLIGLWLTVAVWRRIK
jgi:hypothetical protein